MAHRVSQFRKGFLRIHISGGGCERFLNLCAFHGIFLWDLESGEENAYETNISIREFRKIKPIVRKSHVRLRITERHGFPFILKTWRGRKAGMLGVLAAAALMMWLSSHVWKITIDGNLRLSDDTVFEYLDRAGVQYGMCRRDLDCRKLADEIRNQFPDFSWVAAELDGTCLKIQVREGIFSDAGAAFGQAAPHSLAAAAAGMVESIYVRRGMPLVHRGDTVEKGQILVSGALPILNDSQEVSGYQYTEADASIVVKTDIPYQDKVMKKTREKHYTGNSRKRYLVRIKDMAFSLPDIGVRRFGLHDVTGIEKQLRLMEHFYLPVSFQTLNMKEYEYCEKIYTKEEMTSILNANLQLFMKNLEEKGVQIFENDVKIKWAEVSAEAVGTLTVGISDLMDVPVSEQENAETEQP